MKAKEGDWGKLHPVPSDDVWPYNELTFVWKNEALCSLLNSCLNRYKRQPRKQPRIVLYTGTEGDSVRRVIKFFGGAAKIKLSVHPVEFSHDMDVDDFFRSEEFWREFDQIEERYQAELEDFHKGRNRTK